MLKQILHDMYIDPEILAGLDETQKQTLFCKMREEQIRRWRIWDQNNENSNKRKSNSNSDNRKKVTFRLDESGEPWTWVMGEHPNDCTMDEILSDKAKQQARQLAEIETRELRKSYVAELSDIIDYKNSADVVNTKVIEDVDLISTPKIDESEIYCSVDELRERIKQTNNNNNNNTNNKDTVSAQRVAATNYLQSQQNSYNSRIANFNLTTIHTDQAKILREISNNKPVQKVSAKIALWEKRVIEDKTNEIYQRLKEKQIEIAIEAEEAARKQEVLWKEQERKAKEAEVHMRDIARRAREEHRKSLGTDQIQTLVISAEPNSNSNSSQPSSLDSTISRPNSHDAVVKWYREEEFPRGSGINSETGKPHNWFYGLISRSHAEQLLANELTGTFLIRVSEKIWGYAISYKADDRCKHYLINGSSGSYQFLGTNQLSHDNLNDLVRFHANAAITVSGQELLLRPCTSNGLVTPEILEGLL